MAESDEALCLRIGQGDAAAFEVLMERYQEKAYRLACSILKDTSEARDMSQEAFVKVFQAASSFNGSSRFSTWFYRILVNQCIDHQRRGRWWRKLYSGNAEHGEQTAADALERVPSAAPGPEQEAAAREQLSKVWAEVSRIPPRRRAALMLSVQ